MTSPLPRLILLVDDDIDCLEINRHLLEASGYRVECCFDPNEAAQAMEREVPDLIITDLMMSSLDAGFAFAKQVKQDPRYVRIPVIMLTAVGSSLGFNFRPRTADDLKAMNADAFLEKPMQPKLLLQKVRTLLGEA